jgi:hypothetical protein
METNLPLSGMVYVNLLEGKGELKERLMGPGSGETS